MNRLGIVCGSLSRGGAERVAIYLAEYMKQVNIDVCIITAGKAKNEYKMPEGIERINLNESLNKIKALVVQVIKMNKIVKEKNIDIILIMGVPLCIYAIPGCFFTNAKIIVSERNDPEHFAGKRIVKIVSRCLIKMADGFVFQTRDAEKYYNKLLKKRSVVIPNPLLAENLPQPYQGKREKIIVSSGRLNKQKNQKMLIQVFTEIAEKIPEFKLIIYGEGELRQELETEIRHLNMEERILLPGNVTDLHERIRKASIFVLTSNFEGMPNALIEAMALGIPCISVDCPCGGPRELIKDGVNGILIPIEDTTLLKKAIINIIERSDYAASLGREAVNIKRTLNLDAIGMKWLEYLKTVYYGVKER